jgi:hypothetical protein
LDTVSTTCDSGWVGFKVQKFIDNSRRAGRI